MMDDWRHNWVVVMASWLVHFSSLGTMNTFGVFLPFLMEAFGTTKAMAALVYSIMVCCFYLFGAVNGALVRNYGHRRMARVSTVMVLAGLLLSSFVTDIWQLFLTYGIVLGQGFGLSYMSCITIIALHFSKTRATATGLAVCGSGIGTLALAPTFNALLVQAGWRDTLRFQAGVCSGAILFASFFFNIPHGQHHEPEGDGKHQQAAKETSSSLGAASDEDEAGVQVVIDEQAGYFKTVPLEETHGDQNEDPAASNGIPRPSSSQAEEGGGCGAKKASVPAQQSPSKRLKKQSSLMRLLPPMHFDVSPFRDSRFVLLFLGCFCGGFAYFSPFAHLPAWGMENGLSSSKAALCVTAFGAGSTVGRGLVGKAADVFGHIRIYWIGTTLMALDIAFLAVATDVARLMVFAVVFGVSSGAYIALTPVICADIVGKDQLPCALGFVYMGIGVALLMGPPCAGFLADKINYPTAFGFAALVMFMACAFFTALWVRSTWLDKKRQREGVSMQFSSLQQAAQPEGGAAPDHDDEKNESKEKEATAS
ncbi:unnamed protein product [Vitrella brassicaformis CCMP3155]|uniref:Major facilitator superfamily (MFS) profile domain-containing protein n=1 Tax=Vitrella brassicaformis (strain CCMP3155) TaxID=1169540 RepID=A0A0G4EHI4_VITBC|nr:unnamed protein product [Vitrella brassicaformis CCMP3155]|eukprot:CEL95358.1 unnamed protein product [Vitrella brassicaformis CCMP3155]